MGVLLPPQDVLPPLLRALQAIRACVCKFTDPVTYEEWRRLKFGGPRHGRAPVESNSDWGSTLRVATAALKWRDDFTAFHNRPPAFNIYVYMCV